MLNEGLGILIPSLVTVCGVAGGIVVASTYLGKYHFFRMLYEKPKWELYGKFKYRKNLMRSTRDEVKLSILHTLLDDAYDKNEMYRKVADNLNARGGWPLDREIYELRLGELVDDNVVKTLGHLRYIEYEKIPRRLPGKIKDFMDAEIRNYVSS
jgi:hypothetical protein